MSYSICFNCKEMVGSYQKYCRECEGTYKQDEAFWKKSDSYDAFHNLKEENLTKDKLNSLVRKK